MSIPIERLRDVVNNAEAAEEGACPLAKLDAKEQAELARECIDRRDMALHDKRRLDDAKLRTVRIGQSLKDALEAAGVELD